MQTREEIAWLEALRPTTPALRAPTSLRTPPVAGERFGKLTAVERGEDYARPNGRGHEARWWFRCDCGERVLRRLTTARHNVKRGWCSCPACYVAAGRSKVFEQVPVPA
jgi:hypothetical protein